MNGPDPLVASRERVAEVLFAGDQEAAGSVWTWLEAGPLRKGAYLARADALLAAGVFREPPTLADIERVVTDKLIVSDALVAPGYSARVEADADDIAEAVAPAVLALLKGATS